MSFQDEQAVIAEIFDRCRGSEVLAAGRMVAVNTQQDAEKVYGLLQMGALHSFGYRCSPQKVLDQLNLPGNEG